MSPLSRRVRRTIRLRGLVSDRDRVAIAVSGGSDSVALSWLLRELEARARWQLVGLIHVNHRLRGSESDADESFCRTLAERMHLPIEVSSVDVSTVARQRRQSIEAAARMARYACLEASARALGASIVATGHTQDDQAETVLLRLLRGTGGRGLSAIRPRRGIYVRPLIDCRRQDLVEYLQVLDQPWREDRSNTDFSVPRNRLRYTLLPLIARDWPGGIAALARFAELSADDEQFLTRMALEVTSAAVRPAANGVQVLDVRGLNRLPATLSRRIVRGALEANGGTASFRDIEAVRGLARADKPCGHLDLEHVTVERTGVALRFFAHRRTAPAIGRFEYPLSLPGRAEVGETGTVILASLTRGAFDATWFGDGSTRAAMQADTVAAPFVVRNRRPGDRIRPFGSPGSRKLQDLFVDRKVPRDERDRVPLVVDAAGRIVWVVGLTIAEECRVTAPETGVVVLETMKGNQ